MSCNSVNSGNKLLMQSPLHLCLAAECITVFEIQFSGAAQVSLGAGLCYTMTILV